ncbi:hypothetical protein [Paenibacillus sp. FSL K6-2524]
MPPEKGQKFERYGDERTMDLPDHREVRDKENTDSRLDDKT